MPFVARTVRQMTQTAGPGAPPIPEVPLNAPYAERVWPSAKLLEETAAQYAHAAPSERWITKAEVLQKIAAMAEGWEQLRPDQRAVPLRCYELIGKELGMFQRAPDVHNDNRRIEFMIGPDTPIEVLRWIASHGLPGAGETGGQGQ